MADNPFGNSSKNFDTKFLDFFDKTILPLYNKSLDGYPDSTATKFKRITTIQAENWDKKGLYEIYVARGANLNKVDEFWVVEPSFGEDQVSGGIVLPLNPQNIAISHPIPVQLTPTSKGIIEEFGHVMISDITITGTTGVLPFRAENQKREVAGLLGQVFGGTINAANRVVSSFQALTNTNDKTTGADIDAKTTGYYFLEQLQNYLLRYTEAKREDPGLRLVFADYKRNKKYVCSLSRFSTQKSAERPTLITYTMNLRAWEISDPDQIQLTGQFDNLAPKKAAFLEALNKLRQARLVVANAASVITAVRSDIEQSVLEPLRQGILFCKDVLGIPKALADLPNDLLASFNSYVIQNVDSLIAQAQSTPGISDIWKEYKKAGQTGSQQAINAAFSVSNTVANIAGFDGLDISQISITPVQQLALDLIDEQTRNRTFKDFDADRLKLKSVIEDFEKSVGLKEGVLGFRAANNNDISILGALNSSIQAIDIISPVNGIQNKITMQNVFQDVVNTYTDGNQIQVGAAPNGARLAPVPFGFSLEEIANLYLGNPDAAVDIITLNNLSPPYIDEIGQELSLVANASDDIIVVPSTSDLYIGQKVEIYSSVKLPEVHTILQIKSQGSNLQLTLSSSALTGFNVGDAAKIKFYLPNTINSSSYILLPIGTAPDTSDFVPEARKVYATANLDLVDKIMGVDILTDKNGDIVITPQGDVKYALGMTNALQSLRVLLQSYVGTYLRHPTYGGGVEPGQSNAELNARQIRQGIERTVLSDPRFAAIEGLNVKITGSVSTIDLSVRLANGSGVVSASFTLN